MGLENARVLYVVQRNPVVSAVPQQPSGFGLGNPPGVALTLKVRASTMLPTVSCSSLRIEMARRVWIL